MELGFYLAAGSFNSLFEMRVGVYAVFCGARGVFQFSI